MKYAFLAQIGKNTKKVGASPKFGPYKLFIFKWLQVLNSLDLQKRVGRLSAKGWLMMGTNKVVFSSRPKKAIVIIVYFGIKLYYSKR